MATAATRKAQMAEDPEVVDESLVEAVVEAPPAELGPNPDLSVALFEGGPTLAQVEEWKRQHGDIYVTSFDKDEHYIWRTMTRFEYRRLVKQLEQQVASGQVGQAEANMNNEEAICELCLVFPRLSRPEMAGDQAGVASIIAQEVMEASGFVAVEVRKL